MRQRARAAAEAERVRQLEKQLHSDAERLKKADALQAAGEIRLATKTYILLTLSRPKNQATQTAKDRLDQLKEKALAKLAEIDASLVESATGPDGTDVAQYIPMENDPELLRQFEESKKAFLEGQDDVTSGTEAPTYDDQDLASDASTATSQADDKASDRESAAISPGSYHGEAIRAVFARYNQLARDYALVPGAGRPIRTHISKLKRLPKYAAALNEPRALELFGIAQDHETADQLCCAFYVYRKAADLVPAPSAIKAQQRFSELKQNPDVVRSAAACQDLQECHKIYRRAERLVEIDPEKARGLFGEITQRAPRDSRVYDEARVQFDRLQRKSS